MPNRPPRTWWDRCTAGVAERSHGYDPNRVCGAVWYRKGTAERRAIVRTEERHGDHPGSLRVGDHVFVLRGRHAGFRGYVTRIGSWGRYRVEVQLSRPHPAHGVPTLFDPLYLAKLDR